MLLSHTRNSSEVCFVLEYTALQHVGGRRGLLSLTCRFRHRLCCSPETSPANYSKQLSLAFLQDAMMLSSPLERITSSPSQARQTQACGDSLQLPPTHEDGISLAVKKCSGPPRCWCCSQSISNALCQARKRNSDYFAEPAILPQIQGSIVAQMAGDPGQEAAELLCLLRHLQYLIR